MMSNVEADIASAPFQCALTLHVRRIVTVLDP